MLIFITWIAFSIAVGMFASIRRNRNGVGWFFLALIMSPLLAGIFVAILKETAATPQPPSATRAPDFAELPAAEQARLQRFREDLASRN
jgi:hypothetical protein